MQRLILGKVETAMNRQDAAFDADVGVALSTPGISKTTVNAASVSKMSAVARLVAFGPWDEKGQYAIAVLGLDAVGVDLNRYG